MPACTEEGCTVVADGKCLNGLDPKDCPHFSREEDIVAIKNSTSQPSEKNGITDEDSPKKEPERLIPFYSGEALDVSQCDAVMRQSLTNLILLAGLSNSGKTTMVISLFDLFQGGPFAGFNFAGSRTMIGFEKRSHDSRVASNRSQEDTERTKFRDPPSFLHLVVQHPTAGDFTNLLFTDISGEFFEELNKSSQECRNFILAKRADHFALFLDSASLSNPSARHEVQATSLGVLAGLIDTDMLAKGARIEIVFSRWDLAQGKISEEQLENLFEQIRADCHRRWPELSLSYHRIASRPKYPSTLNAGFGFDTIFPLWVKPCQFESNTDGSTDNNIRNLSTDREFLNYSSHPQ